MQISPNPTSAATNSQLGQAGQEILRSVEHDWRRMCGNQANPAPLGPDPYRMDLALPHMFILQRTGPGAARIRVAGQKLHDMIRVDPRGMSFGTFFNDGARDTALELVEAALTLPAIIHIPLVAQRGFGRKPFRAEALLLPMRDINGELKRVMGVIISDTSLRSKATRWDVDPQREVHCDIQKGHFPDRRDGSRSATEEQPAKNGLRLVVDNTKSLQSA